MMISEFIERTAFEPTADEYAKIEEAYYNFDGDKNTFCKAFVNGNGVSRICRARAEEIFRLRSVILETEKQFKKDVADRDRHIEELTAELDRELEWKPANADTNMTQDRYTDGFSRRYRQVIAPPLADLLKIAYHPNENRLRKQAISFCFVRNDEFVEFCRTKTSKLFH